MLISDLSNAGSLPVLAKALQFAGQRQRLLVHNIANMDTPDFRPVDVSTGDFQASLGRAVQERRERTGGQRGSLEVEDTHEVRHDGRGGLLLTPRTPSGNVLYHDRNDRDLERSMQDLAENGLMFRVVGDLMRREQDVVRAAISQRV